MWLDFVDDRESLEMPICSARLAVVVPTRNRSDLATRAIESVIPQLPDGSLIVVSDNSTQEQHRNKLHAYVKGLARDDVRYLRPPQDLAMPAHWEWAFSQVASNPKITHVTVLTDRMIFKQGALDRLFALIAESPGIIISYSADMVDDYSAPVRLQCPAWSGTTLEVTSARLLELSAAMEFHPALPKMLNSVVPVGHLLKIKAVFGGLFNSVAPDYCFAYRTLSQVDSIRYVDRCLLIHGSLAYSNGASLSRGESTPDSVDFVAKLDGESMNGAAPVPAFQTTANTMTSEYELVRHQTGLPSFVPVDMNAYFARMEFDISAMDSSASSNMRALLYDGPSPLIVVPHSAWRLRLRMFPSRRPSYVVGFLLGAALSSRPTKWLWRWTGARPPQMRWFRFRDAKEAFAFAESPGRRPVRTHPGLQKLRDNSHTG
jgi:hypothetical protein